ncbi:MAG: type I DNA topoisomerase [Clostridiales bacterium]|nr:type I DNA topoisomerase [Clostridiales bacterium]
MKLVVIEGFGKLETVQKYLGSGYKVFATGGHVRDLMPKRLSVDVKNDFQPTYVVMDDKKSVVDSLKKMAASSEQILLATDPDREGEAISWHVATLLDIPQDAAVRIEFNEISKNAIQNALKKPRAIDKSLVDAQQARRVLDRLVGYKVSPVLCQKIQSNLSAGRVQSVTLRLVVDREREIQAFVAEEYWNFFVMLSSPAGEKYKAALIGKSGGDKIKLSSADDVNKVKSDLNGADYVVQNIKRSITKAHPYAPFITSTMQQDALNKLNMSLRQTSSAAQQLYEGVELPGEGKVALITYIRTDSTRVSADAIAAAREYIGGKYGKEYLPDKPNYYASKKSAQDAHEAIRPISLDRTPESVKQHLNKNLYALYNLIYKRFLASQMSDATYNSVSVDISANGYDFRISGRTPVFDGFTKVYAVAEKQNDDKPDEKSSTVPELNIGDKQKFIDYECEQKFTKPPARYTEASLVKAMEEKGIGRPATYTPTVTLLFSRKYIEKSGRAIAPTELGCNVTDMLVRYFPEIMDVGFTANMETELDGIEEGGVRWQSTVAKFYEGFEDKIRAARGDEYTLKAPDEQTDFVCEKCGAKMVIKTGRFGKFLACPNYPKCKNTKNLDENGNIAQPKEQEVSDVVCEKCGAKMVVKTGKYGKFLACPNYPKCKNIVNLESKDGDKKADETPLPPCPKCGKPLKKITTRKATFYGCSGYPDCDFTSSDPPSDKKCPTCGAYLVVKTGKNGKYLKCSNKDCKYKQNVENAQ